MTFDRIKEYNEIISECRRFARNEIRPRALENDITPDSDWTLKLWLKIHELEIPGLLLPEACNGSNYPEICGAYVLDSLSMECAGVATFFAHHFAACLPLSQTHSGNLEFIRDLWNSEDAKSLPVATVIFPHDFNNRTVSIKKDGNGWIVNGKTSLTACPDRARLYCVFILEDSSGEHISCVMMDHPRSGIHLGDKAALSGLKAVCFQEVIFDHVNIPGHFVIASGENGKILFNRFINAYYGFTAAMAMGTARTAYAKTLAYAKERYQFGKTIIHHEEIQRMLGVMKMKIDIGTAGYIQVFNTDRIHLPGWSADGRLAKAFCTQAALEIVSDAIQIHGGYGYMHEYGLEKIMRDVKILQLLGGRNPFHHLQVVGEAL
jgi:acyl-CoA dehydrogenase